VVVPLQFYLAVLGAFRDRRRRLIADWIQAYRVPPLDAGDITFWAGEITEVNDAPVYFQQHVSWEDPAAGRQAVPAGSLFTRAL
jgi:hypothetical protein